MRRDDAKEVGFFVLLLIDYSKRPIDRRVLVSLIWSQRLRSASVHCSPALEQWSVAEVIRG